MFIHFKLLGVDRADRRAYKARLFRLMCGEG
jgi:hypothetical protein